MIVILVLVAAFCALSLIGGNFLFNFALNPAAEFTMMDLAIPNVTEPAEVPEPDSAEMYANTFDDTHLWLEYCKVASQWFEQEKQTIVLERADGSERVGNFFANDGHSYAIVFHGYYGNSAQMAGYANMFYDLGMSVLAPDALAHGESEGEYIGMGWLERGDVLAWIHSIEERDPEAQIMLFGVSMGGATVMMASGEDRLPDSVKCSVEDCGYSSVMDEFSVQIEQTFHLPKFPLLYSANLICRIRAGYWFGEASAVEQLKKAEVPMLFIHGEEDTFVPYEMLDQAYEACASPIKEKLTIPGAAHGVAAAVDPATYWTAIEQFVSRFMTVEETDKEG